MIPAPPSYRDRSRALGVYGGILVASGVACAAFSVVIVAAGRLAAARAGAPTSVTIMNVVLYVALGGGLIAIGIGSIRARRWARSLAIVAGWVWLATGILGLVMTALLIPSALSGAGLPAGTAGCAAVAVGTVLLLFLVLLPLLVLFFYRSADVRRTVEARSPRPDWSDRVSVAILGIAASLVFGAVGAFASAATTRQVPLFGAVFVGASATAILVATGVVCAVLAWATWRRAAAAWWALLVLQAASVADVFLLRHADVAEYLSSAGFGEEEVRGAAAHGIFGTPGLLAVVVAASIALFVFLFAVRKDFSGPGEDSGRESRRFI